MLFLISGLLLAAPVSKSFLTGVAIGGHDSVHYHSEMAQVSHQAIQGKYEFRWQGAVWKFASPSSRDVFAADPERYAPAYNGFCANALSLGEGLIKTDGSVWQIFDNQLFLFYAPAGRERWLRGDAAEYKAKADVAWERLSKSD